MIKKYGTYIPPIDNDEQQNERGMRISLKICSSKQPVSGVNLRRSSIVKNFKKK